MNYLNYVHENDIIVIKAGTGVVSNAERTALDLEAIGYIGDDIACSKWQRKYQVADNKIERRLNTVLVTSGAVTAGIERLGWSRQEVDSDIDLKRVASMAGNTALFSAFEQATGLIAATDLLTHNDLDTQESWEHLKSAINLARNRGLLAIFNEGDARSSEELETTLQVNGKEFKRFGDNDWLASHLAVQLGALSLVFLTTTDGVLKRGRGLKELWLEDIDNFIGEHVDDLEASNGGMTSKLLAAKFALSHGVERVFIGNGKRRYMSTAGVERGWGTTIIR